jgi:hypothetical protein
MRASARLLFAIAFIGGVDNAALAGSRASLADLLGQGYEVKATSTLSLTDSKALNEENTRLQYALSALHSGSLSAPRKMIPCTRLRGAT